MIPRSHEWGLQGYSNRISLDTGPGNHVSQKASAQKVQLRAFGGKRVTTAA